MDLTEEGGLVEVGLDPSRRLTAKILGPFNQRPCGFLIYVPPGVHATDDTGTSHGDVCAIMSQQDSRADALVAAACGIGPIDAVQNRNPQVVKVGMAVKRRTVGASPGIDSLLLHELDATAVGQPDKRHI